MKDISLLQEPFAFIGKVTIQFIQELGRIAIFFFKGIINIFSFPFQFLKIINQIYFIGFKSILVICLTGIFAGMVLGFQGYYTLVKFGFTASLGTAVALSLIRELGPVLTAIMITARAGSAITAEIGVMRIYEQIDALETMDINPIKFLISPIFVASLISFPILTAIFDLIGILGGLVSGSFLLGLSPGIYFSSIDSSVILSDVTGGFIKSIIFAFLVSTICCYQGYYTHLRSYGFGAKGISYSTTSAVVISCVLILIADYVLTSFLM